MIMAGPLHDVPSSDLLTALPCTLLLTSTCLEQTPDPEHGVIAFWQQGLAKVSEPMYECLDLN